ncbi:hypothetical protein ABZ078_01910 [Streptomyces sp. NPDC006385]|uniref:hypothetical protein n=1 Tax=Streptomyces sp. NPDC006385 TaxID=3156761 RepID=UPI0033AC7F7D
MVIVEVTAGDATGTGRLGVRPGGDRRLGGTITPAQGIGHGLTLRAEEVQEYRVG